MNILKYAAYQFYIARGPGQQNPSSLPQGLIWILSVTNSSSVSSLILEKLTILSSVLSHYLNKAERKRLLLAHSAETVCSLKTFSYLCLIQSPVPRAWNNSIRRRNGCFFQEKSRTRALEESKVWKITNRKRKMV